MIIQVVLLAALLSVVVYALTQRRRAFLPSVAMIAVAVVGGLFVVAPGTANSIAHWFGVGRGADLILYCFVVLMLVAVFNLHLRLRSERETMTELARSIALLSARRPIDS